MVTEKIDKAIVKKGYPYVFNPGACETCMGRCCNGDSGNVWLNSEEIKMISRFLKMDEVLFLSTYARKNGYRYTLKELFQGGNYACVFYDAAQNGCTIYPVKPKQCTTYPFWDYFKLNSDVVLKECPGISIITSGLTFGGDEK